jgi:DNA-binding NtrC family response regulator
MENREDEWSGERGVVLVVEDSANILSAAMESAHRAGFDALEAANADEAVFILNARTDVEALVMDSVIATGSMNGLTLAHLVQERWPTIELVVIPGDPTIPSSYLPQKAAVLKMPFSPEDLVSVIRQKLGAGGRGRSASAPS